MLAHSSSRILTVRCGASSQVAVVICLLTAVILWLSAVLVFSTPRRQFLLDISGIPACIEQTAAHAHLHPCDVLIGLDVVLLLELNPERQRALQVRNST